MHYLRAYVERAGEGPLEFTASTSDLARDGLVIDAAGWQLDNFQATGGPILWAHDHMRPPIGRAAEVRIDGDKLRTRIEFDLDDPFAAEVERKIRNGFLSAVSVGWDTRKMEPPSGGVPAVVREAELIEISVVPVPADPGALVDRHTAGVRSLAAELADLIASEPSERDELQREVRAGAVLSARNRSRLEQAAALLGEVLAEGDSTPEGDEGDSASDGDADARFSDDDLELIATLTRGLESLTIRKEDE